MRYLSMFVVVVLVFVFAISFAAVAAAESFALRPLDAAASETLASAMEKSETMRLLARSLEGSDLIIHVVTSPMMPASIGGQTRLVTSRGGYRYVRIIINPDLPLRWRSTILARELRNASALAKPRLTDDGRRALQAEPVAKFDH